MKAEGKVIIDKKEVAGCFNYKEYIRKKYIDYHVIKSQSKPGTGKQYCSMTIRSQQNRPCSWLDSSYNGEFYTELFFLQHNFFFSLFLGSEQRQQTGRTVSSAAKHILTGTRIHFPDEFNDPET